LQSASDDLVIIVYFFGPAPLKLGFHLFSSALFPAAVFLPPKSQTLSDFFKTLHNESFWLSIHQSVTDELLKKL